MDIKNTYKRVAVGDSDAFLEVSEWYANKKMPEKALAWATFALNEPENAPLSFVDALSLLKYDIGKFLKNKRHKDLQTILEACEKYCPKILPRKKTISMWESGDYQVMPTIKGIKCIATYVKTEVGYALFKVVALNASMDDITVGSRAFLPDVICRGTFELSNAEIENTLKAEAKQKSVDLKSVDYICVHVTLYVPKSKKEKIKGQGYSTYASIIEALKELPDLRDPMLKLKERGLKIKESAGWNCKNSNFEHLKTKYDHLVLRFKKLKSFHSEKKLNLEAVAGGFSVFDGKLKSFHNETKTKLWLLYFGFEVHGFLKIFPKSDNVLSYISMYHEAYPEREMTGFCLLETETDCNVALKLEYIK